MVGDLEAEGYFILAVLSNCGVCKILEECSKHNCIACNKGLESFMRANEKQGNQTHLQRSQKSGILAAVEI